MIRLAAVTVLAYASARVAAWAARVEDGAPGWRNTLAGALLGAAVLLALDGAVRVVTS